MTICLKLLQKQAGNQMTRLNSVRNIAGTTTAAISGISATAQHWLRADSDVAVVQIARFVSREFTLELVVLALVALLTVFWEMIASACVRLVRRLIAQLPVSSDTGKDRKLRIASFVILGAVGAFSVVQLGPSLAEFARARVAFATKYAKQAFLDELVDQINESTRRLDTQAARDKLTAAIALYGSSERTSSLEIELANIRRAEAYGLILKSRASALELKLGGPNSHSLWLYSNALPFMVTSAEVRTRLSEYESLAQRASDTNSRIRDLFRLRIRRLLKRHPGFEQFFLL